MAQGRWRFVWSTWAAVGGLLGGLGIALLLQQLAVYPLSVGLLATGAVIGIAVGALLPSLTYAILARPNEAEVPQ